MENPVLKQRKNFAIRTIKEGRVKIYGRYYYPGEVHMKYDGRLDGMRYAFGLYYGPNNELQPYASLWGREEQYHTDDVEEFTKLFHSDPQIVDGGYPWMFWKVKE